MKPGTIDAEQDRGGVILAGLVVVLAVAAILRFLPTREGLPYLHDWDEPQIATTALQMMKTGDLNPHFFHYGSLTIYTQLGVDVAHFLAQLRHEDAPFEAVHGIYGHEEMETSAIETYFETGFLWEVSHPSFYLWNRRFNALLGTATVLVTFLLARALAGPLAGLLAAALLAVQGFHIDRSAIVNPDVTMTLCALVAVYASVRFVERPRDGVFLLALVFCGLTMGAKYNGAGVMLAPAAALLLARRDFAARGKERGNKFPRYLLGIGLFAIPPFVFLLTTPYALLDLSSFLRQVGFEVYHYAARGHGAVPVEAGSAHLMLQFGRMAEHFGPLTVFAAMAGGVLLLGRRAGLVTLFFPLLHFFYMSTTRASFQRNLLPVYPIVAVCTAIFVVALARWLRGHTKESPAKPALIVLGLLVAGHLLWLFGTEWRSGYAMATGQETRTRAVEAARELAAEIDGPVRVGLASELRLHRLDLARLNVDYEVAPHLDLVCNAQDYDLLVTGGTYMGMWPQQPEAKRLARRLNQISLGVESREIVHPTGGSLTRIDGLSENPTVVIHLVRRRAADLAEACSS